MTTPSEPGPAEREAELERLRKRMRRAARRGDAAVLERLSVEYADLKAEHVTKTHEAYVAERRAVLAAQRAVRASVGLRRWRLPAGFGTSPLAQQRAREGRPGVPVVPVGRPALSPWRRGGLMTERIWRP